MMNGTPKKHSFSSSGKKKKRKTDEGRGGGGEGDKSKTGWGCVCRHAWRIYYLTSLKYSDKVQCDTVAVTVEASMTES